MDFSNSGVVVLRDGCSESFDKVLICGLPRSGTTGVAAVLEKGGIPMTFSSKRLSSVKEDQSFRAAVIGDDVVSDVVSYFEKRRSDDSTSQILGVKYPEAYKVVDKLSQIDGLVILIVARDPFLVALRNSISMFEDFEFSMNRAIRQYLDLMSGILGIAVKAGNSKIVIIGYEKLLTASEEVLFTLHEVMGMIGSGQEFAMQASAAIEMDSKNYLNESNLRPLYCIDDIADGIINGWCFYQAAPTRPVNLTLQSFGGEKSVQCDDVNVTCVNLRADLKDIGIHPTGRCGFSMSVGEVGMRAFEEGRVGLFVSGSNFRLLKKKT